MESDGSLLCLQYAAIGPIPEPDEFSPSSTLFKIHFNI
jgi:hypothetical protein